MHSQESRRSRRQQAVPAAIGGSGLAIRSLLLITTLLAASTMRIGCTPAREVKRASTAFTGHRKYRFGYFPSSHVRASKRHTRPKRMGPNRPLAALDQLVHENEQTGAGQTEEEPEPTRNGAISAHDRASATHEDAARRLEHDDTCPVHRTTPPGTTDPPNHGPWIQLKTFHVGWC